MSATLGDFNLLLFANIAGFLIIVVGVVVTAATISDPVWKKRSVCAALALGAVWIISNIIVFEQTPGNPQFFSNAFNTLIGFVGTVASNHLFQVAIAAGVGGICGWQLRTVITQKRSPTVSEAVAALRWPNVDEWMSPSDAIDRFSSPEAVDQFSAAMRNYENAERELENAHAGSGVSREFQAISMLSEGSPQFAALRKKVDAQTQLGEARGRLLDGLVRQLRDGTLAGRAAPVEADSLPRQWEFLQPPNWVVLQFDSSDIETVRGGGKTYKGLQIGQHVTPH